MRTNSILRPATAVVLFAFALALPAGAYPRCGGAASPQPINVKSGEEVTLPVASVAGALDYEIQIASGWAVASGNTFLLRPQTTLQTVRSPDTAPQIKETFYGTRDIGGGAYVVVTARNGSNFLCSQDFLIHIEKDAPLTRDALRMVVPVAGFVRGAFNSLFKTRIVLQNPWTDTISGKLVFHRANTPGSASDPSLAYSLASKTMVTYEDVVTAIGATGLGTLDIVPDVTEFGNYPEPFVRADLISAGASGGEFTASLPVVTSSSNIDGVLFDTPQFLVETPHNKRINVGVRSLSAPVTIDGYVYGPDGAQRAHATRTYGADVYEQTPLSSWFSDVQQPGDTILFSIQRTGSFGWAAGSIVFLAETDNTTNDVSIVLPRQKVDTLNQPVIVCSVGSGCTALPQ